MIKMKAYKPRVIQSRFDKEGVADIELVKKTYGHKTDSTIVRYVIRQVAENIRNGRPHVLINQ